MRQETRWKQKHEESQILQQQNGNDKLFAEEFSKFQVRDYQHNTRMNVKNHEYAAQREKRDRAINYWQQNVIPNHLPPIDIKKKLEMQELRKLSTSQVSRKNKNSESLSQSRSIRSQAVKKHTPDYKITKTIRTDAGFADNKSTQSLEYLNLQNL